MKQKPLPERVLSGWTKDRQGYIKSLWAKYRVTQERYDEIFEEQQKKCPGCLEDIAHALKEDEQEGLQAFPDWDEDQPGPVGQTGVRRNGFTRGLLCKTCKTLLTELEWDLDRTKNLMGYLERSGK